MAGKEHGALNLEQVMEEVFNRVVSELPETTGRVAEELGIRMNVRSVPTEQRQAAIFAMGTAWTGSPTKGLYVLRYQPTLAKVHFALFAEPSNPQQSPNEPVFATLTEPYSSDVAKWVLQLTYGEKLPPLPNAGPGQERS